MKAFLNVEIRKVNILRFLIPIFFAIVIASCGKKAEENQSGRQPSEEHSEQEESQIVLSQIQFKGAQITFGRVEQRNLSGTLQVNGTLDVPPQNLISVNAPLGGFVRKTSLLQGSRVKKGQVIAVIENQDFITLQQDYLDTRSRLEYIELEYNRQKELSQENVSSTKTFQQTASEYKSIASRLSGLKQKLELVGINPTALKEDQISRSVQMRSPVNGYVTTVNVNIGKYVNPTDVMFQIVDTEELHAELTLFEKDINRVRPGQKVRFRLQNESKERIARVSLVGKEISPERTVRVHTLIEKPDEDLLPNMFIKAVIETDSASVNAVPDEAIVSSEGKKYIFIRKGILHDHVEKESHEHNEKTEGHPHTGEQHKEGDHDESEQIAFQMVEIQTGISENGYSEVILPKNFDTIHSQLVIKGAYSLLSVKNNGGDEGHGH
jgi:cobalt-zinc-cadmium efflux system membrane fusion protein